jgi:hypothetical protein
MNLRKNNMVEYKGLQVGDKIRECGFWNCKNRIATVIGVKDDEFDYKYDEPYYTRFLGVSGMVEDGTCVNHGNHYWEKI